MLEQRLADHAAADVAQASQRNDVAESGDATRGNDLHARPAAELAVERKRRAAQGAVPADVGDEDFLDAVGFDPEEDLLDRCGSFALPSGDADRTVADVDRRNHARGAERLDERGEQLR
jgi:hypothetical protein